MKNKFSIKAMYATIGGLLLVIGLLSVQVYQLQGDTDEDAVADSSNLIIPDESAQTTSMPEDGIVAGEQQTSIEYLGVEGKTALELLYDHANVVTKTSSFGEYVDSINGIQGGTDSKYWIFYINDEMAQIGASEYETQEGDVIVWRFE